MCENARQRNVSHFTQMIIFVTFLRGISHSCSTMFPWFMHQESDTLPEEKLPHTASSFNTGLKEITLLLLAALKSQLSSAPPFTPFREMGTWTELSTGGWRGQSLHFPAQ